MTTMLTSRSSVTISMPPKHAGQDSVFTVAGADAGNLKSPGLPSGDHTAGLKPNGLHGCMSRALLGGSQ